jgi:hypothetical protein
MTFPNTGAADGWSVPASRRGFRRLVAVVPRRPVKPHGHATDNSPCDKTTAGPGARRGRGQETQILGRQGHPHQSCRTWLHHGDEVRDAQVLLSRRAGRSLVFRTAHSPMDRLGADPRAFPDPKAQKGPQECRERGPCSPLCNKLDFAISAGWPTKKDLARVEKAREAAAGS